MSVATRKHVMHTLTAASSAALCQGMALQHYIYTQPVHASSNTTQHRPWACLWFSKQHGMFPNKANPTLAKQTAGTVHLCKHSTATQHNHRKVCWSSIPDGNDSNLILQGLMIIT